MRNFFIINILGIVLCTFFGSLAHAQEPVGEIFGVPVSAENYNFAKAAVILFGNKWGAQPKDENALEEIVWEQLILSYAAFVNEIQVERAEVEGEIERMLRAYNLSLDRSVDAQAYASWVRQKTGVSVEVFEGLIAHQLQLKKLREDILKQIASRVTVSRQEARDKFLREHNTLSVELIQFDDQERAEEFYRAARRSEKAWRKRTERFPETVKRPGFVSLEFLIDLWGFPEKAAFEMMAQGIGQVYPPQPIYKGYAVFKIIEKGPADESRFDGASEEYTQKARTIKAHEGLKNWVERLKKEAQLKKGISAKGEEER